MYLTVNTVKPDIVSTNQKVPFVNPFIKMIEDKKNEEHSQAIEEGKTLSALNDIKCVKPV